MLERAAVITYDDYLRFRSRYFPRQHEIAADPAALCRFGEYRFACEQLELEPGLELLDLACSSNVFQLFLALSGLRVTGIDIDARTLDDLEPRRRHVEQVSGRRLDYRFEVSNAFSLPYPDGSYDRVISISSVEHMFSDDGRSGDVLAVLEARRVLRPGGRLVVTVPMSEGMPFHESRTGDDRYRLPYRLYTPAVLEERFHGLPGLELVAQAYVPHRVPLPDTEANEFMQFWMGRSYEGRAEWDRWAPILVDVFQPLVYLDADPEGVTPAHNGLMAFVAC